MAAFNLRDCKFNPHTTSTTVVAPRPVSFTLQRLMSVQYKRTRDWRKTCNCSCCADRGNQKEIRRLRKQSTTQYKWFRWLLYLYCSADDASLLCLCFAAMAVIERKEAKIKFCALWHPNNVCSLSIRGTGQSQSLVMDKRVGG